MEITFGRVGQRAKIDGVKKLPEFEKFFPQGKDYEVYACSFRVQCSKCDVPEEGIYYLAQTTRKPMLWSLFAEFDGQIEPDYCLVYYRKGFFCYVPLTESQKTSIEQLNTDFYRAWMVTKYNYFDPGDSTFSPLTFMLDKTFYKGTKICGNFFKTLQKLIKKESPDALDKIDFEFEKFSKKIEKKYRGLQIYSDLTLYQDLALFFNDELQSAFGLSHGNIRTGPSGGESLASFFIGVPSSKLTVEPLYLIPNGKRTIAILLIPNSGFSFKYFSQYQSFYSLIKRIHNFLKDYVKGHSNE